MDQGRHRHEQSNNRRLTNRKVAVASSVFGLLEVFIGTFAAICGFVLLGGFCENLDCPGISRGLGLWIGFPVWCIFFNNETITYTIYQIRLRVYLFFSTVSFNLVPRGFLPFWYKEGGFSLSKRQEALGTRLCFFSFITFWVEESNFKLDRIYISLTSWDDK